MNSYNNPLFRAMQVCVIVLWITLIVALAQAQTPATGTLSSASKASKVKPLAVVNPNVQGSGSIGHLTKWLGFNSSNSFITDSVILEDKFGHIGIGTANPTSPLTVQGMIEITLGGYKFPDGTVQTTAAVSGLQFVFTDSTLQGNGTSGSPLGVHLPLTLSGAAANGVLLDVQNTGKGGDGLRVVAGDSPDLGVLGGVGIRTKGGDPPLTFGGEGVFAIGGASVSGGGGTGGSLIGGASTSGNGGDGLFAVGALGVGAGNHGGNGIIASSGSGTSGGTAGGGG